MDVHLELDRDAGALFGQIADGLRTAIRTGRLVTGGRLPSTRDLARDLGVSRGVVVSVYEQLVAEGFLRSRQGDGTRVVCTMVGSSVSDATSEAHRQTLDLGAACEADPADLPGIDYDLRPGKPDLASFPRERWLAAVRETMRVLPHGAFNYPDPGGAAELRGELGDYLGRVRAAVAAPENIVIMAGVAQVLALLPPILLEEGRPLLAVEDPLGDHQQPMLTATGIGLAGVPVDDEGIDVELLAATGARAVLLTPAHQYPTGVVLSPRRRSALLDWARDVDAIVVEDDYDAEFRYDRDPVGCLQGLAPEQVVLAGSVSKSLAPALRLGWVLAPPWLAGRLRAARSLLDLGSPSIDQYALARLMASGGYDRHLRQMRRQYRVRRDALVSALRTLLPAVRVHGVSAGLHVYVELPAGCDESATVLAAAERGVAVAGVASMRVQAPGPPALVLGYARLPERRAAEAVSRLADALS
jgi:DNA-binding transcriptional MocR family regulator